MGFGRPFSPRLLGKYPTIDVVRDFKASGVREKTTGSIAAGTVSLTVADSSTYAPQQGIWIQSAGVGGADAVSTIDHISGNLITLTDPAVTTVSGSVTQHDDSKAINSALALAWNNGGGAVYVPRMYYRCNDYLNAITNSILTLPQSPGYSDPRRIELVGECRGWLSPGLSQYGGTIIDCSDAVASGVVPSIFAAATPKAPVTSDSDWQPVDFFTDQIYYLLKSNSLMSGLLFVNCLKASVGDSLSIVACDIPGTVPLVAPTNFSTGIWFPQALNNVICNCGSALVAGFRYGVAAGEHLDLRNPYLAFNYSGLGVISLQSHLISGGVRIENCIRLIEISSPCCIDLTMQSESAPAGLWYSTEANGGFYDPGNQSHGRLAHAHFDLASGTSALPKNGGAGVSFTDLRI